MQTLKYNRCKFAFISIFVFNNTRISNLIHSEPMLSKISEVYEWDKKPLQKVFTLHYWRFFWFKYLFSLFCITLICLWSCLLGIIMSRRIHRVRAEARAGGGEGGLRLSGKQRDLAIYTHTPIMYSWLYTVYELACAYSTQAFVLFCFKERFANSTLFGGPCPTPLSDPWLRSIFCSSSSCLWVHVTLKTKRKKKGRSSDFQH